MAVDKKSRRYINTVIAKKIVKAVYRIKPTDLKFDWSEDVPGIYEVCVKDKDNGMYTVSVYCFQLKDEDFERSCFRVYYTPSREKNLGPKPKFEWSFVIPGSLKSFSEKEFLASEKNLTLCPPSSEFDEWDVYKNMTKAKK